MGLIAAWTFHAFFSLVLIFLAVLSPHPILSILFFTCFLAAQFVIIDKGSLHKHLTKTAILDRRRSDVYF